MKKKTRVLWLSAIACNGNAHSFLNYPFLEQFLDDFEFIYHPFIETAYSLEEIVTQEIFCDILLIEGALSKEFSRAGVCIEKLVHKYGAIAQHVVTLGTCATFGGIFRESAYAQTTGLHFDQEKKIQTYKDLEQKTISLSGCPSHPELLANTLYALKKQQQLSLDLYNRPKEYYCYTVHNGCTRNEYFEYKIDTHNFGSLEGCMFYDHGCKAPYTQASCNKILWNEVSSKTRVGHPCLGCTEPNFPQGNFFVTKKNMGIPQNLPLGVPKRAYLTLAGIAKAFTIERLQKKLLDD